MFPSLVPPVSFLGTTRVQLAFKAQGVCTPKRKEERKQAGWPSYCKLASKNTVSAEQKSIPAIGPLNGSL